MHNTQTLVKMYNMLLVYDHPIAQSPLKQLKYFFESWRSQRGEQTFFFLVFFVERHFCVKINIINCCNIFDSNGMSPNLRRELCPSPNVSLGPSSLDNVQTFMTVLVATTQVSSIHRRFLCRYRISLPFITNMSK